jgi:hypothetical protein
MQVAVEQVAVLKVFTHQGRRSSIVIISALVREIKAGMPDRYANRLWPSIGTVTLEKPNVGGHFKLSESLLNANGATVNYPS